MYKSKLSDFQRALEEALLAENGILDTNLGAGEIANPEANPKEMQEATDSNLDQQCSGNQASFSVQIFLLFF